jgi:hypothetical protein
MGQAIGVYPALWGSIGQREVAFAAYDRTGRTWRATEQEVVELAFEVGEEEVLQEPVADDTESPSPAPHDDDPF